MISFKLISDIIENSGYRNGIISASFIFILALIIILVFVWLDWSEKKSKSK